MRYPYIRRSKSLGVTGNGAHNLGGIRRLPLQGGRVAMAHYRFIPGGPLLSCIGSGYVVMSHTRHNTMYEY